ncbi:hypothetical protein GCM10010222_33020 [Streptomyces tanashiensis]|nr:hypothetical protein GCM10010222_33020 [Streptomyces tanashiensis]
MRGTTLIMWGSSVGKAVSFRREVGVDRFGPPDAACVIAFTFLQSVWRTSGQSMSIRAVVAR